MAKSIIDIELKAEAFEKFAALFKNYNDQLSKMPGTWNKVAKAMEGSADPFERMQHALDNIASSLDDSYVAMGKLAKEQDKLNKHTSTSEKMFKGMGGALKGAAKDVASISMQMTKWTALGLVGAGGAGLFGISSLAGSAGDVRRRSQGLGVTPGELRAATTGFGRYINPETTMSSIAEAQADPSKRWAFSATGVNPNVSAAQALPELMRAAAKEFKAGPESTAAVRLQAKGYTELGISVSDARRLAALKDSELDQAVKQYAVNRRMLDQSDEVLKAWQSLDVQLEVSKTKIEKAFIDGLIPLIPNIEKFSDSVAEAVKIFLSNPEMGRWLEDFGEGIKNAAEWLAQFDFGKKHFAEQHAGQEEALRKGDYFTPKAKGWMKDQWSSATNFFTGKGWTPEQAAGITGNLQQESGMNPGATNPKSGMKGLAQWDSNRRRDFAAKYGKPIEMASMQEQLDFINYELTEGKERKAGAALRQATTAGQAASIFESKYERSGGADLGNRIGYANAAYAAHISSLRQNSVRVTMQNNTGGSATAVVGAVATPDLGYSAFAGAQ